MNKSKRTKNCKYASFIKPVIQYNEHGWGPCDEIQTDIPYQPFSKSERLGKICDWILQPQSEIKYTNIYSPFGDTSQYAYFHDDDEDATFHLVDTSRTPKPPQQRARYRPNLRYMHGGHVRNSRVASLAETYIRNNKLYAARRNLIKKYGQQTNRDSSVVVRSNWISIEEMNFSRLLKLSLPNIKEGVDIITCGKMEYYDKSYDRISVRHEKPLLKSNRLIAATSTIDDPVMRSLSKTIGNVYATDDILATIMCTTRSNYSWDITIDKVGKKIFFDKRNISQFDLLTVNETSQDASVCEDCTINAPESLSIEATYINHNFRQQVLKTGEPENEYKFEQPNPFEEQGVEMVNFGYRYKKWNLGNNIILVARCKHDGVLQTPSGDLQFLTIRALNEWDSRQSSCVEWRQKLDTQSGAVLASELRNNSCKLAKWAVEAVLAGSHQLKLGYVSRVSPRDPLHHVILGIQQFKPQEFATQINLSMDNAWGILRCIIDLVMIQKDGKYLLVKDPNKPILRLYNVPDNAFDSDTCEQIDEETDDDDIYPGIFCDPDSKE